MKKEHEVKLDRTEANMLRWMCGERRIQITVGTGTSQFSYQER